MAQIGVMDTSERVLGIKGSQSPPKAVCKSLELVSLGKAGYRPESVGQFGANPSKTVGLPVELGVRLMDTPVSDIPDFSLWVVPLADFPCSLPEGRGLPDQLDKPTAATTGKSHTHTIAWLLIVTRKVKEAKTDESGAGKQGKPEAGIVRVRRQRRLLFWTRDRPELDRFAKLKGPVLGPKVFWGSALHNLIPKNRKCEGLSNWSLHFDYNP